MTSVINKIKGAAKFCFLSDPDEGFGASKYHVLLEVPKAEAQGHMAVIKKIISNEIVEQGKLLPNHTAKFTEAPLPFTENGDVVEFKIHSKFKPKMFDRKGKLLGEEVKIWKDSTMFITYKALGYNKSMGIGCTLYIQHGQIDNLVTGAAGGESSPYTDLDEAEKLTSSLKSLVVDDPVPAPQHRKELF